MTVPYDPHSPNADPLPVNTPTPLDGQVTLVAYDPAWPGMFEQQAARIRAALGDRALRIEHVGSTSVPGLVAKPCIDILLVVADAGLLWQIARQRRRIAVLLAGLTLAATALYAVAFVSLYAEPHPWVMVSRWLHENARTASVIATEKWDEALPSSVTVGGELRSRNVFEAVELDWLGGIGPNDTTEKLAHNLERLAASDYLIVASNRSYGVAGRLPAYYPLTGRYYAHLFAGDLGFEPVFVSGRAPRLGPLWLWPDRFEHARLQPPPLAAEYLASRPLLHLGYADESFTVYDQPFAIIFRNTGRLSPAEMMARIAAP